MKRISAEERFWSKVDKGDGQGCWLWKACRSPLGYGQFRHERTRFAHRVSYEMANGPVDDGVCILHKCDNPSCVNPAHLMAGTHADNVADKVAKGRQPRGERVGGVKLTEEQVLEVFSRHERGEKYRVIAASLGVKIGTITAILLGKNWSHVPGKRVMAGPRRGERNPVSKLTEAQVREAFSLTASGETQRRIAARFGVSETAIGLILRGKNWGHLTEDLRKTIYGQQEKA